MSAVPILHETTTALYELVQKLPSQKERDTAIEQITSLLEKRTTLINEIKPPYSAEEMKLGKDIVSMNTFIDTQLVQLQEMIKQDIQNAKKKKQSQKKYVNPYNSMTTLDGAFYDKRK